MPLSIPSHKFLIDENVRSELFRHLSKQDIDIKLVPKGATDSEVASISKSQDRILVTNDEDFIEYPTNKILGVIWLRIPQNEPRSLLSSFEKLLKEAKNFKGKVTVLEPNKWHQLPQAIEVVVK